MQTRFTSQQLEDPETAAAEQVLRKCVHCGFCLATCPTYAVLGDELDSPRGRIYLIKDMLENARAPSERVIRHLDRCLSCLSCMTTCPSGVEYRRLIDHARAYVERSGARPWRERALRALVVWTLTDRVRFRFAAAVGRMARPVAAPIAAMLKSRTLAALLDALPPAPSHAVAAPPEPMADRPAPRGRVALLQGCVEPEVAPQIQAAAVRVIERMGFEVRRIAGEGCCGALALHTGAEAGARTCVDHNAGLWRRALDAGDIDAVIAASSGCSSMLKDYSSVPGRSEDAAGLGDRTYDLLEFIVRHGPPPTVRTGLPAVAVQTPCSLQHGLKTPRQPADLLRTAGFEIRTPKDAHLCCGSAGVYPVFQPELASELRRRKLQTLDVLGAPVIATSNVGCLAHLAARSAAPVVHAIELLDWASGGPEPRAMAALSPLRSAG